MSADDLILCACSSYEEKYYFNTRYKGLPQTIKEELQIMCVLFTEDIGGELMLSFSENGKLLIHVSSHEDDFSYDEIGSALKIKQMQKDKEELFMQLEEYYRAFFTA